MKIVLPKGKLMKAWFLLFSCNLMWALQFTCIKLVQHQVGPLFTVWGPMTLATLMLWPLVRKEVTSLPIAKPRKGWLSQAILFIVLALFGVFPGQVLVTIGTRISLASNAAMLMLALPVCTAVMAFFFLGEKMKLVRAISFIMAIAGVLLCSMNDFKGFDLGTTYLVGNLLILSGVLGSAFYNSYGKRVLESYSELEMLYRTYVAMFFIMTPFVLYKEWHTFSQIGGFTGRTWIGLALLAFFHNFLSMVLFLKALNNLDASQAALSNYLITIFGVAIAAVWLGEKLTLPAIIGGVMVLAGTLLVTMGEQKKEKAAPVASTLAAN
jgi:drug/metabolite transporter (DMT)-like permease